jgi:hypothetical protein
VIDAVGTENRIEAVGLEGDALAGSINDRKWVLIDLGITACNRIYAHAFTGKIVENGT